MSDHQQNESVDLTSADSPHFNMSESPTEVVAWEEVEKGRFLPRRIRGSCTGRALG